MRLRLVALSIAITLPFAALAHAARDATYEAKLDAELAAIDPSLVPRFRQATKDLDEERFADAAAGLEAIHKAAPDFTPATRRLCRADIELGQGERGMELCREAVAKARNADNLTMLALALFATESPKDAAESMRVASEAVAKEPDNVDANTTSCVIARTRHELDPFRACTRNLLRLKPDDPSTHLFAAQVAGNDGDFSEARAELARAHQLGLKDAEYQDELADLEAANPWYMRVFDVAKWVPIGWMAIVLAIALASGVVAKPLRDQIARARRKPAGKVTFTEPSGLAALIRVTTLTYLSSGILWVLLVAATTGVVGFGAYKTQAIPWKIVATLAFVTVYLALSVIGGLRAPEDERADEPLDLDEEPEWKKLLGKMKKRLGVDVPTKLSIVPGKELSVLRDGSIAARLRGEGLTGILVGREAFDAMDERTFQARLAQAVVAASGDGAIATTARFDEILTLTRAGHDDGGSSGLFSPAYWIVRLIAMAARSILGAARECREILGDLAAAKHYGRNALLEGLEATGDADKERKKFVSALAEGAAEPGERTLWDLFEDAEAAKKKLEGGEEEEEDDDDAHAHEDEDEDEAPESESDSESESESDSESESESDSDEDDD